MAKIIYIASCFLAITNLVFSQHTKKVSFEDPIYSLNTHHKEDTITVSDTNKLYSNELPHFIFYTNAGTDITAPFVIGSCNVLLPHNFSFGLGYRHWIVEDENINGISLNFKSFKITKAHNLSSFGVDAGTTFRIDYSPDSPKRFINMYSSYLFLSPNYFWGLKVSKNFFLTLNVKLDIMVAPGFISSLPVYNPGISAGFLF